MIAKKPLKITVDDPQSRDIYRRIAAGESPHTFVITESIYYARIADEAWRAKVEAEAAEARRRRGGRPRQLSADRINDAQAVVRQYMENTGIRKRWFLIDKAQEHCCARGIRVSESTVIRHVVEPVRGKKRNRE